MADKITVTRGKMSTSSLSDANSTTIIDQRSTPDYSGIKCTNKINGVKYVGKETAKHEGEIHEKFSIYIAANTHSENNVWYMVQSVLPQICPHKRGPLPAMNTKLSKSASRPLSRIGSPQKAQKVVSRQSRFDRTY